MKPQSGVKPGLALVLRRELRWMRRRPAMPIMTLGFPLLVFAMLAAVFNTGLPTRLHMILLLVVLGLPLFFLSGVSWPTESMPGWLSMAAQCIPSIPAMNAAVRIGQMGASLADVASELHTLALDTGVYAMAAVFCQIVRDKRELTIGPQTYASTKKI